jgi:hypothetical protein
MVDLVGSRARLQDAPKLARSGLRRLLGPLQNPEFTRALQALTTHPAWRAMLERHPVRAAAEYRAFFAQQLPGKRFEVLDVTPTRRILALDSGSMA